MKCVLCRKEYEGEGNDAKPLAKGKCCDICNFLVGKERIRNNNIRIEREKKENKK